VAVVVVGSNKFVTNPPARPRPRRENRDVGFFFVGALSRAAHTRKNLFFCFFPPRWSRAARALRKILFCFFIARRRPEEKSSSAEHSSVHSRNYFLKKRKRRRRRRNFFGCMVRENFSILNLQQIETISFVLSYKVYLLSLLGDFAFLGEVRRLLLHRCFLVRRGGGASFTNTRMHLLHRCYLLR